MQFPTLYNYCSNPNVNVFILWKCPISEISEGTWLLRRLGWKYIVTSLVCKYDLYYEFCRTVHSEAYLSVNCPLGKLWEELWSAAFSISRTPPVTTGALLSFVITSSCQVSTTFFVAPKLTGSSWNWTCRIGLTRFTMMTVTVEIAMQAHPTRVQVFGNSLGS